MPANPKWSKWVFASLAKALADVADAASVPRVIETLEERKDAFNNSTLRAEIRVTGPTVREQTKGQWRIEAWGNVLLTAVLPEVDAPTGGLDSYRLHELAGQFQSVMAGRIGLFRYGKEDGDDATHFGCLSPVPRKADDIKVHHFGQVHATDRVLQAMVDAHYYCNLTE